MEIIIKPEFRDLIPELSADEYQQLEQNILSEGVRDALVLWGDTLIDGHHRYEIAQRHGLKFKTVQREFEDEADARIWIYKNQAGRRNLNDFQRVEMAHHCEEAIRARAEQRMTAGKAADPVEIFPQGKARDELGAMAGVSGKTYEHAAAVIESAPEAVKNAARKNVLSINAAYDVTRMPPAEQREVAERIEQGEPPKAVVSEVKRRAKQKKQQDPPKPPEPAQEPEAASTARRCKFSVADHLMHGQENALTARDLQRILGVTGPELRRRVHDERMSGTPILSSTDMRNPGYYLPERGDEIRRFATCLRKRGQEIIEAADALEAGAVDEVA